jgi:hypothetical protein
MKAHRWPLTAAIIIWAFAAIAGGYQSNPFVITLEIPAPQDSAGGIIVADVNKDGKMDYLVTVPGHLAVYDNGGARLWIKKVEICVGGSSESEGLPGHHGPGVAAADVEPWTVVGDNPARPIKKRLLRGTTT